MHLRNVRVEIATGTPRNCKRDRRDLSPQRVELHLDCGSDLEGKGITSAIFQHNQPMRLPARRANTQGCLSLNRLIQRWGGEQDRCCTHRSAFALTREAYLGCTTQPLQASLRDSDQSEQTNSQLSSLTRVWRSLQLALLESGSSPGCRVPANARCYFVAQRTGSAEARAVAGASGLPSLRRCSTRKVLPPLDQTSTRHRCLLGRRQAPSARRPRSAPGVD